MRRQASGVRPAGARRWLLAAVLLSACGYQPVYGGGEGQPRYEVVAGAYATASVEAVQAAVAGARSELGAAQRLGSGFPRVVVEIVRVDERSIGAQLAPNDLPLARGSEIVVVGRARVFTSESAAASIDTGDISRAAQFAAGPTPSADNLARARAARDAARAVGQALGRSLLGLPVPAEG